MDKKKSIEELLISIFSLVNEAKVEYEKNIQNTLQNATKRNFSLSGTELIDRKKTNDENIMNFNFVEKKQNIVDELEKKLKNHLFNEIGKDIMELPDLHQKIIFNDLKTEIKKKVEYDKNKNVKTDIDNLISAVDKKIKHGILNEEK